jgi:mannose-1-phosphate guanylyltransferase
VLAGGQGVRLRPLIRLLYGDERPKQFATLIGSKSLLVDTLERASICVLPERTIVVICRGHERYLEGEFGNSAKGTVLIQPLDRGTAAGILLPAHWVAARDPKAVLVVMPSDHLVRDGAAFMGHVAELATVVERHPERIILLGAKATGPETEYGWIEPAGLERPLGRTVAGPICRVARFWEKPSARQAIVCFEKGFLWNTFVMVARASTLVEAGRLALPGLHAHLSRVAPLADQEPVSSSLDEVYRLTPDADFSRSVLESYPSLLAVSLMPTLMWSDLGTPERVLRCLTRLGIKLPLPGSVGTLPGRAKQEAP